MRGERKGTMAWAAVLLVLFLGAADARAVEDGDLDPTFGAGGLVTTDAGGLDVVRDVAVQADGKIVAVGFKYDNETDEEYTGDFAVARYNPDGSLDTDFGPGGVGVVITDASDNGTDDRAMAVALQADGKIVAAGFVKVWKEAPLFFASGREYARDLRGTGGYDYDFALVRYNADGSLDAGFGTGGVVRTDVTGNLDYAFGVAVQSDGRIVVAGGADLGSYLPLMVRYESDGNVDETFGDNGFFVGDSGELRGGAMFLDVALDSRERIVAAGLHAILPSPVLHAEGSQGLEAFADKMALRIALPDFDFFLARLNTDGTLDTSLDSKGWTTTDIAGGNEDAAFGVTIQSDGKIVAAGTTGDSVDIYDNENIRAFPGIGDFALVRYNENGSLDASFSGDGIAITDFGSNDGARDVAIQSDGRIVAAGVAGEPDQMSRKAFKTRELNGTTPARDFALARYLSNGNLDEDFGDDGTGKATTDFAGGQDGAYGVAIQSDGKIVAAGGTGGQVLTRDAYRTASLEDLYSTRLDADGPFFFGDFALARYRVNRPPQAVDDSITVDWSATATMLDSGENSVLANDSDPDGDALILSTTPLSGPDHGALVLNTDGTFSYTHDGSANYADGFVYRICDGGRPELCDTATVSISVVRPWTLNVEILGGGSVFSVPGGIDCSDVCTEIYLDGTPVGLFPEAEEGWQFDHWEGDCTGSEGCTVTMDRDRSVTAVFYSAVEPTIGGPDWVPFAMEGGGWMAGFVFESGASNLSARRQGRQEAANVAPGRPVIIELPDGAEDCSHYDWEVYDLNGRSLNVFDLRGNKLSGDENMTVDAGVVSDSTYRLRFELTGVAGYYHIQAVCRDFERLYAAGVVVW